MNPNFVIEPTHVIQRQLWEISGIGPSSYDAVNGDVINFQGTQFPSCVPGGFLSQSGNYELKPYPSITNNLRPTWAFLWFYSGKQGVSGVVQNVAGSGMTPGTVVPLVFAGGGGSGAAGTLTVLTATTFSIKITNSGAGYTSAPTATVTGTGGTPPTLTASAAPGSGSVPNGTDLSAEKVQYFVIGGEM